MKTTTNIFNRKRIIVVIVMFVLSSLKMFGQEGQTTGPVFIKGDVEVASATQSNSQMELVMWIIGTQAQVKSNNITNTISTNGTSKKTYINVGMTPNRILTKTILKKAAFHASAIA